MSTITIDDVVFNFHDLSEEVISNIGMLQAVEAEVQRLNVQLAIAKTAQIAYARAIQANLPQTTQ